jgi:hypothetical protein
MSSTVLGWENSSSWVHLQGGTLHEHAMFALLRKHSTTLPGQIHNSFVCSLLMFMLLLYLQAGVLQAWYTYYCRTCTSCSM